MTRDNPKEKYGSVKPCISFIPPIALLEEAVAMQLGASKYGPYNWNDKPIRASAYYSAAYRHMATWFTGQDIDPESMAHELAHARACFGILIDAQSMGNLIDDRPNTTHAGNAIRRLTKPGLIPP
jgi:Domain of unknown function (DUF5664)